MGAEQSTDQQSASESQQTDFVVIGSGIGGILILQLARFRGGVVRVQMCTNILLHAFCLQACAVLLC